MGTTKWLAWILPVAGLAFAVAQVPIPHNQQGQRDLAGYWQVLQTGR